MTQHTNHRAPYYAPIPNGTRVTYRGKRATVVRHENADPTTLAYGWRHVYTIRIGGIYGDYVNSRVRPNELTRR
jgi:hypothetical protein